MPSYTHVKKARKAIPEHGIEAGESYYHWSTRVAGKFVKNYSKIPPKASQMTTSEFWRTVFELQELSTVLPSPEDLADDRDALVEELETLKDETQEKYDNLPENFQQADNGIRLEERVSALDDAITTLQNVDMESYDETQFNSREEWRDEVWAEIQNALEISCE